MEEEKEKKVYCGSGKKRTDNWAKATINIDKIKNHIEEYKGTKFVRVNINFEDKVNEYGKDVLISIDKWKPEYVEEETL